MLGMEISFDDKALSAYNISVSKTFKNPEDALYHLLNNKPFKVEKNKSCIYHHSVRQASTEKQYGNKAIRTSQTICFHRNCTRQENRRYTNFHTPRNNYHSR